MPTLLVAVPIVVLASLVSACGRSHDVPEEVAFNRDIRPILSDKCFVCHGPDPGTREGDLRLDLREVATARRDGYEHPAIVPGDAGASELVRRIHATDPDVMMPPPDTRAALTEREKALLKAWVEQGAEWQPHWLYVAPTRRTPPATASHPIDAFIEARLAEEGVEPSPEADPVTLARRVSFDLTGLPLDAAARYASEGSYEELVDSLLASPRYGERMAMMWLDLVRYADTDGYHSDLHRNVSPFRDYVVDAFTSNKPFDQFTREQLAGDLLPHATTEQRIAAGYNRLGQATKEGGSQAKEYLAKYAGDRVRTVTTVWMGSTVGCAECHDHKFDPFTQKEFYEMAAFFADVQEEGVYPNENLLPPEMPLPDREQAEELAALEAEIAQRRRQGGSVVAVLARRDDLMESMPHMLATRSVEPRTMRLLRRGNWRDNGGPIVEPDVPDVLPPLDVDSRRADRLDLADWLVSDRNPTTARVFVNHLWARFFGNGIARVLDDLGSQGEWPTHPDLLDWLAVEFVESGWDVKHVVRLIVTSGTYRQSSTATEDLRLLDPENRLLARQSRFRMDAEMIRDNALAVSGLLDGRIGGESVKPYQPEGYWSEIQTFGTDGPASAWSPSEGDDQYRRGLYTYWKRSFLHPSLLAFDASDRQECTAQRPRSNTPLQALALLNDPTYVEAARVFAERILEEGGDEVEERVEWAFRQALSRSPSPDEVRELASLYEDERGWYDGRPDEARELAAVGRRRPMTDDLVDLAAWTATARALFNTHEFITRY
ncbi:MAG: PSD1 and planctomycete cytochrome C domain-containing protein [Rhodothermales bacterium]